MKLCRFQHKDFFAPHYGMIEGDYVRALLDADAFGSRPRARADKIPLSQVTIIAPVAPSKIVCVGRNYREHAAELGNPLPKEPLLFLKAPSAIIASGEKIHLPPESSQVEHEGELGVVIGRTACRIPQTDDPLSYALGYTCVNDVTARDLQRKDVQFTRAKSFDTFCPVGPIISTDIDPLDAEVTTRLNGQVKQQARTSAMAFNVSMLLRYISHAMTLYPGDLIATGTPAGVSTMKPGDVVEVEIDGVGVLRNEVSSAVCAPDSA
ncbi:MAG TPA: fumarylacetoacetate hydrolase family protein [Pyrinomonadaceae bacterium]|jgi:2-keto-4-pentenoate hydratase/2-oxohepta-3-ene-1,7-dioic acid hydratase in catechol pathway|nr:fumarylacetoacetate hydrolase family protein [Pyrinomonadaceae bacterium]